MPAADRVTLSHSSKVESTAIYVHWPFCAKKCPYCDFNSHVREQVDQSRWRAALVREIDTLAEHHPGLQARSLFFGGGTPSLMPPETTHAVIERIRHHWGNADIEVTLEANPSSVEAERFRAYAEAGVNRLSLGIQSLQDDALAFLGRLHDAGAARRALDVATSTFDRVSFDLIYARPDHISNPDAWAQELKSALDIAPSHLSLYQLTIEDNTAFKLQYARGRFDLPDEDEAFALYEMTQEMCAAKGLPAYEISNHAGPGDESRHNLAYWEGRSYVGIGPGAHGRLPAEQGAVATEGVKRPEDWLKAVDEQGHGYRVADLVPASERMVEALMMGLRLQAGVDLADLEKRIGVSARSHLDADALALHVGEGYLTLEQNRLKLTPKGTPLLNALLARIVVP